MKPSRNLPSQLLRRVFLAAMFLLQMNANAEGEPVKRAELDQLQKIAASEFTKVVDHSFSPDKRLAVAVGTLDGGKPVWEKILSDDRPSFVLADSQSDNCGNYLIDVATDRVIGILESSHFGTDDRYNHESALFAWSGDSRWLVVTQSWKWNTAVCVLHQVNPKGLSIDRLDFIPVAAAVVSARLLAQFPKLTAEDISRYAVTIQDTRISNDGMFTVKISAEIPKDENSEFVNLAVVAKIEHTENGDLVCKVTKVDVAKEEDGE